jgi:ADP-ribose pyrophosphatase YjhB (NUDIX family)
MTKVQVTRISAYGLVTESDHLLLCRLSAALPHAGMWTLPGGGIEFGEHPEAAMVREVEEETGLIVAPVRLAGIDSFSAEVPDRAFHAVRIIYHANRIGGTLRDESEGTTDACQWHPLNTLGSLPVVELVEAALPLLAGGGRAGRRNRVTSG